MYSFALYTFLYFIATTGTSVPVAGFNKAYYILRVLRLIVSPLCFSYVLPHLQPSYLFERIQPTQVLQACPAELRGSASAPVCKSPAALSRMQPTLLAITYNEWNSVETIIPLRRDRSCIVSFSITNNYRDLTAASPPRRIGSYRRTCRIAGKFLIRSVLRCASISSPTIFSISKWPERFKVSFQLQLQKIFTLSVAGRT